MKKLNHIYLSTAVMTLVIVSCNNNPGKDAIDDCPSSYELIGGDTVNVLTCHGKQGKWVPSTSNTLQDTTYYKDDIII